MTRSSEPQHGMRIYANPPLGYFLGHATAPHTLCFSSVLLAGALLAPCWQFDISQCLTCIAGAAVAKQGGA